MYIQALNLYKPLNNVSFGKRHTLPLQTSVHDKSWRCNPKDFSNEQKITVNCILQMAKEALDLAGSVMTNPETIIYNPNFETQFFSKVYSKKPYNSIAIEEKITDKETILTIKDNKSYNSRIYTYTYCNGKLRAFSLLKKDYIELQKYEKYLFYPDGKTVKAYSKQEEKMQQNENEVYQYALFDKNGRITTYCEDATIDSDGNILEAKRRKDFNYLI